MWWRGRCKACSGTRCEAEADVGVGSDAGGIRDFARTWAGFPAWGGGGKGGEHNSRGDRKNPNPPKKLNAICRYIHIPLAGPLLV